MTEKEQIKRLESKIDRLIKLLSQDEKTPCPFLYDFLDNWLTEIKAPCINKKSLNVLKSGVDNYIKPRIKNKPLSDIRPEEIQRIIYAVPFDYMRLVVYSIFRAVFARAAAFGIPNPTDMISPVRHYRKKGKALTLTEQRTFIVTAENDPFRPLWLFYLLSGCRRSEALALKWSDIDKNGNRIHIRGTKTPAADRFIPLFPQLSDLLETIPRNSEYVFPHTFYAVRYHFRKFREKCGFYFRIHDLRHTFATRCLESGIAVSTVQKWLGHTSPNITAGVYIHVQSEFERQEIARFDPKF